MPTLDVGIAMLGMHSIRETCATADLAAYETFMTAFLAGC
jgi:aspartyl aminopeptidase